MKLCCQLVLKIKIDYCALQASLLPPFLTKCSTSVRAFLLLKTFNNFKLPNNVKSDSLKKQVESLIPHMRRDAAIIFM